MYGVENRFKMQLLLSLKGSPLRHGNPATKDYLTPSCGVKNPLMVTLHVVVPRHPELLPNQEPELVRRVVKLQVGQN